MRRFEGVQVPGLAAHDEGVGLVDGEEAAQQAQVLLDVVEQEMHLTAQRGRQGFSTGPVQFEVGELQAELLHSAWLEVEAQGRPLWRGPLWCSSWAAFRSSPVPCTQGPS